MPTPYYSCFWSITLILVSHSNSRLRGASSRLGGEKSPTTQTFPSDGTPKSRRGLPAALPLASSTPKVLSLPITPSLSQSIDFATTGDLNSMSDFPRPLPVWLNPAYVKHIVKGNFMTLSSRPKTVEQGEWIAHQGRLPSDSAFSLALLQDQRT